MQGVYEGAFDAASNAVVRGIVQTETETIMYGWGSQYTPVQPEPASPSVTASTLNTIDEPLATPSLRQDHFKSSLFATAGGKGA